jgi:hypothetical protein
MKPFNRINNLSLKKLKTIYIWKIGGDKPKLCHVCASINGAAIFLKNELNSLVTVRVHQYLDTPIPIEKTFLVTSELKWKTDELKEQMKYLQKNN